MKLRYVFITVLLLLILPGSASAYFFPTATGVEWRYASTSQPAETSLVLGPVIYASVDGKYQCALVEYRGSGPDEGLQQLWITLEDGSIRLAGFYIYSGVYGYLYDPPLLMRKPGVGFGGAWIDTVTGVPFPSGTLQTVIVRHEVVEEGQRGLPIGSVDVLGITSTIIGVSRPALFSARSSTGRAKEVEGTPPPEVWVAGLGLVEFGTGTYQLVNTNIDTPTRPTTWGAIKRLYR